MTLRQCFGTFLFVAVMAIIPGSTPAAERPNILFILADDVGREVLGCYGGTSYETPHLDELAKTGMRFTHCYSMPVCHPSRICLMTGKYPARLGNPRWGSFPEKQEKETFGSILQSAGYKTAIAGKWQLTLMKNDKQHPARMGFDEWSLFGWHEGPRYHEPLVYENGKPRTDTKGAYGPDLYVQFLTSFIERNQKAPFFAYYSMALAHDVTDDIGKPVPYGPDGHWLTYAEMANDMDRQIGKLVATLDRLKLRDKTLIIYTTDNGTAAASYLKFENGKYVRPKVFSEFEGRQVQGGKGKLNDWGTRVPLIVNWPGHIAAGQLADDLVDFSDFLPTFAEIAGADLPKGEKLDGISFASRLLNQGQSKRTWAYAEHRGMRFVRTRDHKLYDNGTFFNLKADPEEQSPLKPEQGSSSDQKTRSRLQGVLDQLPAPK